jgi:uncharacterized protein (TIGR03435 family)
MIGKICIAGLLGCGIAMGQASEGAKAGAAPDAAAAGKAIKFEVVSIRLHRVTSDGSRWLNPTADGYETRNVELAQLILEAYGIKCSDQLVGLPPWASEDTFDIEAKVDEDILPAYQELSDRERKERAAPMLRSMLADRFNLKVHHESRILPVYALVVAKGGSKLKQSQAPENLYGMVEGRGYLSTRAGPIGARFVVGLSDKTGRIVIDKTGLTGYYDIELKWSSDEDLAAGALGPTLFTALEEQLGLKLVSEKAPVDVVVVDHIDRPSQN